ncbi:MAG TPA: sulfurtransferase TusA family protein [Jiangellaceae bacterium]|nr:sulfurtransferase TusA family protein [Jiangellaceae bacterium]
MSSVRPENAGLVLDCRQMRCPLPVIELAKHISDVAVGEVIAILADDPAAATDIPAWCRMRGHEYLGPGPHGAASTHLVRRRR